MYGSDESRSRRAGFQARHFHEECFGETNARYLNRVFDDTGADRKAMMAAASADNLLDVSHLSVHFDATPVLTDLSFNVAKGSSLAIIGANGAGKTVLLRALIGSLPFSGTVQWKAAQSPCAYTARRDRSSFSLPQRCSCSASCRNRNGYESEHNSRFGC